MTHEATVRPVVVAPTYNNAGTLLDVLAAVEALGLSLIVVNDGCTDATEDLLRRWRERPRPHGVEVLTHPVNQGKAAALSTGFAHALTRQWTHAATIDTDGQHDPAELPHLLDQARLNPQALVLGTRRGGATIAPGRHRLGRTISDWLVTRAAGRKLADSQCGMRVYPLDLWRELDCQARHYAFETEIVIRAARLGRPIVEVPIATKYLPPDRRVSHFRPLLDSWRWLMMMRPWLLAKPPASSQAP